MSKMVKLLLVVSFVVARVPLASAELIDPVLYECDFNVNGTVHSVPVDGSTPSLAGFDFSRFNTQTGLGIIKYSVTAVKAGTYSLLGFFDHELSQSQNTFFNEYGAVSNKGALSEGQSWEIDEPGWTYGDIYGNFAAGTLDNSNGVPYSSPDDVSMALGWNFFLDAGCTATIEFILSDIAPASGFYLSQNEHQNWIPSSRNDVVDGPLFFSSKLEKHGSTAVPEPATISLLGGGLAGMLLLKRRRSHPGQLS